MQTTVEADELWNWQKHEAKWNFKLTITAEQKSEFITFNPEGYENACAEFHGGISCGWYCISLKTTNMNLVVWHKEMSRDHQSH